MSDFFNDLTGSDEERSNKYKLMISKLEEYTYFTVNDYYDDINKIDLEIEDTLDKIINILSNYSDEEIDKSNYKTIIKPLIYDTFYTNQPFDIKIPVNERLLANHYLFYLKNKLEALKVIIA